MRYFVSAIISSCIYAVFLEYAKLKNGRCLLYTRLLQILKNIREDVIVKRRTLVYSIGRIDEEDIKKAFSSCLSELSGKKKPELASEDFIYKYAKRTVEAVCIYSDIDILREELNRIINDLQAESTEAEKEYQKNKSLIISIGLALALVVFIMLI